MDSWERTIRILFFSIVTLLIAASLPASADGLKGQLFLPQDNGEYRLLVKFSPSTGPDLDANSKLLFRHRAPLETRCGR